MSRSCRKSPDELMSEAVWTRKDACRVLRIDPRTLDRYLYHSNPRMRLPSIKVGNTIMIEKRKLLEYFRNHLEFPSFEGDALQV
jgi:hypothetical protein